MRWIGEYAHTVYTVCAYLHDLHDLRLFTSACAIRIIPMGLTHVTTTVRRLAGRGKGFTADFLVDTGAVDSLAPAKALRKAGIKPEGKNVYEPAGRRPVQRDHATYDNAVIPVF